MIPLLLLGIPLFCAILIAFAPASKAEGLSKLLGVLYAVCCIAVFAGFYINSPQTELKWDVCWYTTLGLRFTLVLGPLSMLFILLTGMLSALVFLSIVPFQKSYTVFRGFHKKPIIWETFPSKQVYSLLFLMVFALSGVFLAQDALLFYVFWELALIPIFFIGLACSTASRATLIKFFVYTVLGSLSMLLGFIYVYLHTGSGGMHSWAYEAMATAAQNLPIKEQAFVFCALFMAFAIKLPVFPFHSWQPNTYVEMPVYGTMMLSGIMLKMGVYGVAHWLIPLTPLGLELVRDPILIMTIVGVLYASVIAIQQTDFKRLIAYSSMAHVGIIVCGLFSVNDQGMQGALFQSFSHGLCVIGLLLICQMLEQRYGTRVLSDLGGIRAQHPWFSVLFLVLTLGSVALPLTSSFIGEFLIFNGLYTYSTAMMGFAGLSVILGAVYMLRAYQRSMLGPEKINSETGPTWSKTHYYLLAGIAVLILFLGIYPAPLNSLAELATEKIFNIMNQPTDYPLD